MNKNNPDNILLSACGLARLLYRLSSSSSSIKSDAALHFTSSNTYTVVQKVRPLFLIAHIFNPLMGTGNYSATSNNMKLVHWPLMGGLLHLVQRGGDWTGCAQSQWCSRGRTRGNAVAPCIFGGNAVPPNNTRTRGNGDTIAFHQIRL